MDSALAVALLLMFGALVGVVIRVWRRFDRRGQITLVAVLVFVGGLFWPTVYNPTEGAWVTGLGDHAEKIVFSAPRVSTWSASGNSFSFVSAASPDDVFAA